MESKYSNKFKTVEQILKKEGINIDYGAPYIHSSPLILVAEKGGLKLLKLLIDALANVNYENNLGNTGYSEAFDNDKSEAIKILIENSFTI